MKSKVLQIRVTSTVKNSKNLDNGHPKNCCNDPKILRMSFYHRVMHQKIADRIAKSVDPEIAPP